LGWNRQRAERAALTPAERARALWALQAATFLTWGGFFVVVPLIAVHYVDDLGWAAGSIGIVLAVRQFLQQGSSTFSGALADRLGAKGLICIGLLIRVAGFGLMAWADSFWILLLSAIITALGGGIFEAPKNAAVAALTDETNRRRYYSLMGVVAGLGTALGTQVGALLIKADFATVAFCGAGVFLIASLLMAVCLPSLAVATSEHGLFQGLSFALRDRVFVLYALLMVGYYFVSTQFNISLILRATEITGTEASVSWIFAIQSGVTILFGYPFPRLVERHSSAFAMLVAGIGLIALGMGLVAGAVTTPLLLGCVAVISVGTILARPGEQMVTAGMADPTARGSYFGIAALSLAIGGGMGNFAGGYIYDYGTASGRPALPWFVFAIVGAVAMIGLWRMRSAVRAASARAQSPAAAATASAKPEQRTVAAPNSGAGNGFEPEPAIERTNPPYVLDVLNNA
jgi:DHA1 family multidrug resistance protein-like MFS transporter